MTKQLQYTTKHAFSSWKRMRKRKGLSTNYVKWDVRSITCTSWRSNFDFELFKHKSIMHKWKFIYQIWISHSRIHWDTKWPSRILQKWVKIFRNSLFELSLSAKQKSCFLPQCFWLNFREDFRKMFSFLNQLAPKIERKLKQPNKKNNSSTVRIFSWSELEFLKI